MEISQPVVKYVARWRIDEYSKWITRYFDSVDDLNEYWCGFHSYILVPKCIKESYKVVFYPLNVIHGKEKHFVFAESASK